MEKAELSAQERKSLLEVLEARFEGNAQRHGGIGWGDVIKRLDTRGDALWSLSEMERTGGEPDVIGWDAQTGECLFCDCSAESPAGRRNLCYDRRALDERKQNKPAGSAMEMAAAMGTALLTQQQYRQLQQLGAFDQKTSSWIYTPGEIRMLGGALFCDRRYGHVFVYHNGAEAYYAARGFRALLRV